MFRKLFVMLSYGMLAGFLVLGFSSHYGCSGGGTDTCTTDTDCQTGQTCKGGKCEQKTTCTADTDCQTGNVCNKKSGKCVPDCTADGFAGCDTGNKCDNAVKYCVCDPDTCKEPNASNSGCHPVTNICDTYCTGDDQCDAGEKCLGPDGKKFCQDPNSVVDECTKDEECTDAAKPVCDTASSPKKCIPKPGCKNDDDCKDNVDNPFCDTTTGQCLECNEDDHCDPGYICDNSNKCVEDKPAACTDTATCNDKNPKSYCDGDKKDDGCKEAALTCTADNKAKKDNKAWEEGIKKGLGSIIWGVTTQRVSSKSCVEYAKDGSGQKVSCSDDSDCSGIGDELCWKVTNHCVNKIKNGAVEISFHFYNKAGKFSTVFKKAISSKDEAERLSIKDGDKTSGKAQFSICANAGGSYQFFVLDDDDHPSNALCFTVGPK